MNKTLSQKLEEEYAEKLRIKIQLEKGVNEKIDGKSLKDFSKISQYLQGRNYFFDRGIIQAHLDFEPITTQIAEGKPFYLISGRNPSGDLTLGHYALFKLLLEMQRMGANIVIPLTNDESFIDGKNNDMKQGIKIAYQSIPYLIAMGFDPDKTKIFVHTEYMDLYRLSMYFGNLVSMSQLNSLFGKDSTNTPSKVFYRGALQLSSILMLQLKEFGGPQHTLVPVGVDQHPYILLARDVAKKAGLIPPSELVLPFLPSGDHPLNKMSSSKGDSVIRVTNSKQQISKAIHSSYTGSLSTLEGHKKYGAIPEICPVFQILRYHHPNTEYVQEVEEGYKKGILNTSELKYIVTKFLIEDLSELQRRAKAVTKKDIDKYLLKTPIKSI